MKIKSLNIQMTSTSMMVITLLAMSFMFQACTSCQSNSTNGDEQVEVKIDTKNEDVKEFLEKELNTSTEDEHSNYSEDQKKEVRASQEKRSKILNEELNASSFKEASDEEIIAYFNEELELYQNTCDTAVFNGIRRVMNRDARIKVFSASQIEFSQDFRSRIKEALQKCK